MEIYCVIYRFVCSPTKKKCTELYSYRGKGGPPMLDMMIISIRFFVRFCELLLFFIFLKEKNAKTSFRLEIKCSNNFLHKKCRFCIISLKNIAAIPLLQQLPETFRTPTNSMPSTLIKS